MECMVSTSLGDGLLDFVSDPANAKLSCLFVNFIEIVCDSYFLLTKADILHFGLTAFSCIFQ